MTNRFVNNAGTASLGGGSANPLNFAAGLKGMLGGTSATLPVTFVTTNTGVPDFSGNSLTVLTLPGNAMTNNNANGGLQPLQSVDTGVTDKAQISTDPGHDVTFGSVDGTDAGTETESRNVTFAPSATGAGGLYATNKFFDGFVYLQEVAGPGENAVGISSNNTARAYVGTDVYQPASVSGAVVGNALVLTNAKHTVNTASSKDIGARSAAFVSNITLSNTTQSEWSVDAGFTASTSIADNSNVTAADFNATGALNGVYTGKLSVTMQNDQSLLGAAANDLGTANYTLSTTVTANSGNGTANIVAGGSFAGYNIHRGSGKDSTVKFLAGTSASGGNISVAWADGVNTTASDKATIGTTSASDLYVLQMSYDNTAITNGTTSPALASDIGNKFIGAVNGDGAVTPLEINGGYDNNLVLGHYGIDATNHVVWAVVNYAGDFEVTQRLVGDANGDGKVDLSDLSTVLNGFGSTTALWSAGNFDGAATIDLTDLSGVLNNFGSSVPNASVAGVATPAIVEIPEPASLGLLTIGLLPLLKRRRR